MSKRKLVEIGTTRSLGVLAVLLAGAASASAAEVYNKNGVLLNLNGEVQAFGAVSSEDYDFDLTKDRGRVTWTEGIVKLGLSTEIDITRGWKVFGTLTGIGSGTGGEGDAGGYALGGDGAIDIYEASGGIKFQAGDKGPGFKLSGGRQAVKIADGFIIGADVPTLGSATSFGLGDRFNEGGAYYLNARKTFENTAVLNVETGTPLRFDAFYLQSGKNVQGETEVAGGNVEAVSEKWGKIGFMYTRVLKTDNDPLFFTAREDDTNMLTIHGATSLGIKDFELAGNYTRQSRDAGANPNQDDDNFKVDAYGWYAGATYKFTNVKWTPEIMYRYSSFSGDNPNTAAREGFDPLFFGSLRWSTWFQGEIAANYTGPFNSNVDVQQVRLTANPTDTITVGAIYNHFTTEYPATSGALGTEPLAGRTSRDFGSEIDLYAEIVVNKSLYISPLYGAMFPGEGQKQTWGKDDVTHYFQLLAIYTY